MDKVKVIINGVTIKDDFAVSPNVDPKYLISLEIEEELNDIIPSATIKCKRSINNILTLTQNQVVEIYNETERIFYGYIMNITKESITTIEANMETINLLRKKVNKLYRFY